MELDRDVNQIDSDECFRESFRMVLNQGSDHNDGEAYYKRGQWLVNNARNNARVWKYLVTNYKDCTVGLYDYPLGK